MDYTALPPEINSGRMYAGPGSTSMLAAAQAWDELANELYTTAHNYGSVVSSLTGGSWQGPASASMAAAAAPHSAWLTTTAAQAEQAGTQARAAAGAHATAYAMTVPPPVITANRATLAALVASNILGQNAPAIAATEAQYGQMWAQDAAAMHGYAAASQAAAQVTPFSSPQQTSNSGALGSQDASQAANASGGAGSVGQALSGLSQALTSSGSGLAGGGSLADIFALPTDFAMDAGIIATIFSADLYSGAALPGALIADVAPASLAEAPAAALVSTTASAERAASATVGKATAISGMSVPQGWATAAPGMRLATAEAPNIGRGAGGMFGNMPLFGGAPLMTLPGRGDSRNQHDSDEAQRKARGGRAAI